MGLLVAVASSGRASFFALVFRKSDDHTKNLKIQNETATNNARHSPDATEFVKGIRGNEGKIKNGGVVEQTATPRETTEKGTAMLN